MVLWPVIDPPEQTDEDAKPPLTCCAVNPEDYDKFMKGPTDVNPADVVPKVYHDYLDVFSKPLSEELPPRRPGVDHKINLTVSDHQILPFKRPFPASQEELEAISKYINEMIRLGYIRPSSGPMASPSILVKKPGGGIRFCVDYRAVNAITIKNRYPIPRVRETLDKLCKAKYYTKLDIIAAFNRIRIAEGDEWKIAFVTRFGQFEYLVMPFGLCNAPATFQSYINTTLQSLLDDFCTAYLDDILIFSNTLEEHRRHVREVLERLRKVELYVDVKKCEFHSQKVKYLGMIISVEGL
jgi:hypothetical protein